MRTRSDTATIEEQIGEMETQLAQTRKRLAELRRQVPREAVDDYMLLGPEGEQIKLSQMFGDKEDLILIHNMGRSCPYCTLWADGFNGLVAHFESRASFAVVSPDEPEAQQAFLRDRGWSFKMYSGQGSAFIRDMGFEPDEGKYLPGASVFHKSTDGKIVRVARTAFGPGDDYCSIWHFFDLLAEGRDGWSPKYE